MLQEQLLGHDRRGSRLFSVRRGDRSLCRLLPLLTPKLRYVYRAKLVNTSLLNEQTIIQTEQGGEGHTEGGSNENGSFKLP